MRCVQYDRLSLSNSSASLQYNNNDDNSNNDILMIVRLRLEMHACDWSKLRHETYTKSQYCPY